MYELLPLGGLLAHAHQRRVRGWLSVASEPYPATPGSLCAVIDLSEEDDPDNPPFAVEHGLKQVLDMGTVWQIVTNLRQ